MRGRKEITLLFQRKRHTDCNRYYQLAALLVKCAAR